MFIVIISIISVANPAKYSIFVSISTSDYYQIREMLIKRSYTFYHYWDIPIDPDNWYCGYIPLECILDYCIKIVRLYM